MAGAHCRLLTANHLATSITSGAVLEHLHIDRLFGLRPIDLGCADGREQHMSRAADLARLREWLLLGRTKLARGGSIVGVLHSVEPARRARSRTTGNLLRESVSERGRVNPSNQRLEHGQRKCESIIADVDRGFFCDRLVPERGYKQVDGSSVCARARPPNQRGGSWQIGCGPNRDLFSILAL